MGENTKSPAFLEFLKILDPTIDSSFPLCAKIEKTLFGCYVTDDDSDESDLSGFLSSKGSNDESSSNNHDDPQEAPSRFTWRNSVSLLLYPRYKSLVLHNNY